METTERLSLPMLAAGQSQKEVFHNEALQILDTIVAAAVEEPPRNDPPASPAAGSCYVIGGTPTGDWQERADYLAAFTSAGWRFVAPAPGLVVFVKTTGVFATFGATGWQLGTVSGSRLVIDGTQVVGSQASQIASPVGGTTIDLEARAALDQLLVALRTHGLDRYRMKSRVPTVTCVEVARRVMLFRNSRGDSPVARKPALSYVFPSSVIERARKGDISYAQACHWIGARIDRAGDAGACPRR